MKIIDLTMPLDERTPAYPGDPVIQIEQIAHLSENGWNEKRIHINTHCGTHVDVPAHFVQDAKTIDKISLDNFQGRGILVDARKKEIDSALLNDLKIIPQSIVLFLTGQSDKRYTTYYENAKFISEDVAKKLVSKKVKAIGIDSFSPDKEPYPIHKILLPQGILIIENLINLKELIGKEFTMQFFPLNITQGDGAPCRALAFVN